MAYLDFKIVQKDGDVTIVRNEKIAQKQSTISSQSIRVQCFDAAQIDRIFRYQENGSQQSETKHVSVLKKILKF